VPSLLLWGCKQHNDVLQNQDSDIPDRLGSWNQINQSVTRGQDWQQIVVDSPFELGEKTFAGSWSVPGDKEDFYDLGFGTYPRIDGSTVAVPMAMEFAWQHLGLSDGDARDFVVFSTTHTAYENLITKSSNQSGGIYSENAFLDKDHPVDLLIATEPSEDELVIAKEYGVVLVQKPVCYDAFVFITHKNNPVDSLTLEQVRGIYSGEITNWKEVGGDNAEIVAYQREENSGSQTAMINLVMKDTPMLPAMKIEVVEGMGELVEAVAEYKNNKASIGYTYEYYINALYKNENIKMLKIDGKSPDEKNLKTGTYPLTTCYYGVIRAGDENKPGGLFLEWMLSKEGQRCIKQAGYIPYKEL
jgi:phosphate transport system substrate-binding protein